MRILAKATAFLLVSITVRPSTSQEEVVALPFDDDVYAEWHQESKYEKSTFLSNPQDPTKGVALHWTINDDKIYLAVAAKAQGWAGFGIAESGSMRGSDTLLFSAESKELVDGYVLDALVKPIPDVCQSWTLVNHTIDDEFIIFEASRALDTGDTQDHPFVEDREVYLAPTRVIAAWGDTPEPSFHGSDFAMGAVRFFAKGEVDSFKMFKATVEAEAEGTFELVASDFLIPNEETTYVDLCISFDELKAQGVPMDDELHLIGVEAILDPRAIAHVHHFLVSGTSLPWDRSQSCEDDFEFADLLYLWAPGAVPFQPPSNVGVPLGGTSGYTSLKIEIHYNNPTGLEGVLDSSGVRGYFTSQRREFDAGLLSLGDPSVEASPVILSKKGGLTQHAFTCPGDCTSNYFQEPVTVFAETLHMHENGKSVSNEQIRDGEVIRKGIGQYYDFDAQGGLNVVQAPFEVKPGDSFRTICTFDADPGERWGLASSEEMCIAYLFYYPRQTIPIEDKSGVVVTQFQPLCGIDFEQYLPGCGSEYDATPELKSSELIDRDFGKANGICGISGASTALFSLASVVASVAVMFVVG